MDDEKINKKSNIAFQNNVTAEENPNYEVQIQFAEQEEEKKQQDLNQDDYDEDQDRDDWGTLENINQWEDNGLEAYQISNDRDDRQQQQVARRSQKRGKISREKNKRQKTLEEQQLENQNYIKAQKQFNGSLNSLDYKIFCSSTNMKFYDDNQIQSDDTTKFQTTDVRDLWQAQKLHLSYQSLDKQIVEEIRLYKQFNFIDQLIQSSSNMMLLYDQQLDFNFKQRRYRMNPLLTPQEALNFLETKFSLPLNEIFDIFKMFQIFSHDDTIKIQGSCILYLEEWVLNGKDASKLKWCPEDIDFFVYNMHLQPKQLQFIRKCIEIKLSQIGYKNVKTCISQSYDGCYFNDSRYFSVLTIRYDNDNGSPINTIQLVFTHKYIADVFETHGFLNQTKLTTLSLLSKDIKFICYRPYKLEWKRAYGRYLKYQKRDYKLIPKDALYKFPYVLKVLKKYLPGYRAEKIGEITEFLVKCDFQSQLIELRKLDSDVQDIKHKFDDKKDGYMIRRNRRDHNLKIEELIMKEEVYNQVQEEQSIVNQDFIMFRNQLEQQYYLQNPLITYYYENQEQLKLNKDIQQELQKNYQYSRRDPNINILDLLLHLDDMKEVYDSYENEIFKEKLFIKLFNKKHAQQDQLDININYNQDQEEIIINQQENNQIQTHAISKEIIVLLLVKLVSFADQLLKKPSNQQQEIQAFIQQQNREIYYSGRGRGRGTYRSFRGRGRGGRGDVYIQW